MLTADLLRARVRKGVVKPGYVERSSEALDRAARLVDVYRDGVGSPRGAVRAEVDGIVGHGTDFLLWRGLAKLCDDRSTFETVSAADPGEIRRRIFETVFAAETFGVDLRQRVVDEVAGELGMHADELSEGMYADLDDRQILTSFEPIEAVELLDRYNLALAQAVLYRAVKLSITLQSPNPDRLRYLFSILKFHGLMHRVRRDGAAIVVEVDGPASLFKLSRKYGFSMAVFLPALLHLEDWVLEAELDWKGKTRTFDLDPTAGLVSHYRPRGQWRTEEDVWFEERFDEKAEEGWSLERRGTIVELPDGEVLVADYVLSDPGGREVLVELVSFWRAAYLRRRIDLLGAIEEPFVLVVSERLKADREKLSAKGLPVVYYKGVILPNKVVDAARTALER